MMDADREGLTDGVAPITDGPTEARMESSIGPPDNDPSNTSETNRRSDNLSEPEKGYRTHAVSRSGLEHRSDSVRDARCRARRRPVQEPLRLPRGAAAARRFDPSQRVPTDWGVEAYDFAEDGSVRYHFRPTERRSRRGTAFDCALPPETIRLVIRVLEGLHYDFDQPSTTYSDDYSYASDQSVIANKCEECGNRRQKGLIERPVHELETHYLGNRHRSESRCRPISRNLDSCSPPAHPPYGRSAARSRSHSIDRLPASDSRSRSRGRARRLAREVPFRSPSRSRRGPHRLREEKGQGPSPKAASRPRSRSRIQTDALQRDANATTNRDAGIDDPVLLSEPALRPRSSGHSRGLMGVLRSPSRVKSSPKSRVETVSSPRGRASRSLNKARSRSRNGIRAGNQRFSTPPRSRTRGESRGPDQPRRRALSSFRSRSRSRSSSSSLSTRSKVSSNCPDDKEWKLYRGASGIDIGNLLKLCDRYNKGTVLRIGTNAIFQVGSSLAKALESVAANSDDESHALLLNGNLIKFFTLPNLLRSTWHHFNAFELELIASNPLRRNQLVSILDQLLHSQDSAMRLYDGNTEIGARLLILDLLTAVSDCWLEFLKRVRRKGSWQPRDVSGLQDIEEKMPLLGDRAYLKDFAKTTEDLIKAATIMLEAIEILANMSDEWNRKFKYLSLKLRLKQQRLDAEMSGIEQDANEIIDNVERFNSEKQAASLRRLTLIASIFLPLTTACSLLSMNSRVKDLGPLWWDWLGIVLILAFIVYIGYQLTAEVHEISKNPRMRWVLQIVRTEYGNAKVKTAKRAAKKTSKQNKIWKVITKTTRNFRSFAMMAGIAVATMTMRQSRKKDNENDLSAARHRKLIPFWPRITFRLSPFLLWSGFIASLLIGMFKDIYTGAVAMGYTVAGVAIFILGNIFLWRLAQGLRWLLSSGKKHSSNSKVGVAAADKDVDVESGRRSGPSGFMLGLMRAQGAIYAVIFVFSAGVFLYLLIWGLLFYGLIIFMIGTALLDVLGETAKNGFHILKIILSERATRQRNQPAKNIALSRNSSLSYLSTQYSRARGRGRSRSPSRQRRESPSHDLDERTPTTRDLGKEAEGTQEDPRAEKIMTVNSRRGFINQI